MVPYLNTLFPCWKWVSASRRAVGAIVRLMGALILLLPEVMKAADGPETSEPSAPLRILIGQTLRSGDENQPAEVEGVVTFAGKQGRGASLELSAAAGHLPVTVARASDSFIELLLKSRIRVRGICVGVNNSIDGKLTASLSSPGMNDIVILHAPQETWQRYPLRAIGSLSSDNFF